MRTAAKMALILAAITGAANRSLAGDSESEKGQHYTVIHWDADLRVGGNVVGKVQLADRLLITEETNGWLWFAVRKGWVHHSDAVPSAKAAEHFDRAVADRPSAETFHMRAVFRLRQNELKKALADLQEAHRHDAENPAVLNDLGNLHRQLGQLDKALGDFDELLRLGAKTPEVYTNRGLVHQAAGQHEQALNEFSAALELNEKFAPAWEASGSSRYALGDFLKARENFQRAVGLFPEFALAHNNLAWLLATCPEDELRDGAAAVTSAKKACELTGFTNASYLDTLAAAHAEAGDFDEAVKRATQAIELATSDARAAVETRREKYRAGQSHRQSATVE